MFLKRPTQILTRIDKKKQGSKPIKRQLIDLGVPETVIAAAKEESCAENPLLLKQVVDLLLGLKCDQARDLTVRFSIF